MSDRTTEPPVLERKRRWMLEFDKTSVNHPLCLFRGDTLILRPGSCHLANIKISGRVEKHLQLTVGKHSADSKVYSITGLSACMQTDSIELDVITPDENTQWSAEMLGWAVL